MLDIKFIRENLELCKQAAANKNRDVDWDGLLALDEKRRKLISETEMLRKKRNEISGQGTGDRVQGAVDVEQQKKGKEIKQELKTLDEELRSVEEQFGLLMLTVPNVPDESVPVGKDATGNKEVKTWGKIPQFSFSAKDHIALAKALDLIDFERGAKVGGFRKYFLKNEAVQMELALMFYTLQKLVAKGYTPLIAPALVKGFTLFGSGQFPWGQDEVYKMEKDDLYLAGTAEVPVTAYFSDEILNEKDLPKKFVAFSPCFRREAGSYGKDVKGVYRVHQFNKIEQVIIAPADTSNSLTLLEELLANAEEILQDLELPYRVLLMCTGEMGEPQVKKYDIEAWMPGRGQYGETMSDSFMGDFQARRLKIRYMAIDGRTVFAHTLNNTALASPRILIAILENYQQKDGSIIVPKVLQNLIGKKVIRR
ncbi:serine--tRNA ligase [Patescibacteria group bacterium]|nr:serine--tRNA ligase [Patescibacteria group bacterium]MBU1472701.1 serine--tRNA ligase [Patescibacteria group bacterium]MBU2459968.1 serine--tRNA ligase [Patescibacteria group bacterium]MBU2544374.1 serine--tRNA ligase [Patescibacteria group bacterium]